MSPQFLFKGQYHYFYQGIKRLPNLPKKRVNTNSYTSKLGKWGRVIEEKVRISGYFFMWPACIFFTMTRLLFNMTWLLFKTTWLLLKMTQLLVTMTSYFSKWLLVTLHIEKVTIFSFFNVTLVLLKGPSYFLKWPCYFLKWPAYFYKCPGYF